MIIHKHQEKTICQIPERYDFLYLWKVMRFISVGGTASPLLQIYMLRRSSILYLGHIWTQIRNSANLCKTFHIALGVRYKRMINLVYV